MLTNFHWIWWSNRERSLANTKGGPATNCYKQTNKPYKGECPTGRNTYLGKLISPTVLLSRYFNTVIETLHLSVTKAWWGNRERSPTQRVGQQLTVTNKPYKRRMSAGRNTYLRKFISPTRTTITNVRDRRSFCHMTSTWWFMMTTVSISNLSRI